MEKNHNRLHKAIASAMLLSMALVLPFLTGQIREIGNMLCPMHLPVLICGYICGPIYGLVVGAVAPLLRSVTFGMPNLFPEAAGMSAELAAYGFFSGFLYMVLPRKRIHLYTSLIGAMLLGRAVWGLTRTLLYGVFEAKFSFAIFFASAFTKALPGIILQIILLPPLVITIEKLPSLTRKQ